MIVDKEYFDGWMQRLVERLKRIEVRFIECNFSNFRKPVSYTHLRAHET